MMWIPSLVLLARTVLAACGFTIQCDEARPVSTDLSTLHVLPYGNQSKKGY